MQFAAYANPIYSAADNSTIDCMVTIPGLGTVPYTASASDPVSASLHAAILANQAQVPIGAYVPPPAMKTTSNPPKVLA